MRPKPKRKPTAQRADLLEQVQQENLKFYKRVRRQAKLDGVWDPAEEELSQWQYVAATVVERPPIINLPVEPEVSETVGMLQRFNEAKRYPTPSGFLENPNDPSASLPSMEAEADGKGGDVLDPLPRKTKEDVENKVHSIRRVLDRPLFLLVKKAGREENVWQFPGIAFDSQVDTTMFDAARRGVLEMCSRRCRVRYLSKAPIGHITYEYPEPRTVADPDAPEQQRQVKGAKVFFYHALLKQGRVKPHEQLLADYAWLPKDQALDTIDAANLRELSSTMLFDLSALEA